MTRLDVLNAALRENHGKATRAEKHKEYLSFFVDPIETSVLQDNTNQLIYGRRGSGKTVMLGALHQRLDAAFPDTKVVSFSYSAVRFRSSPDFGGMQPTVKEKTHAFFHSFIEQLCQDIFDFADKVFKRPGWLDYLKLAGDGQAERRGRLVTAVLELLEAARYGAESPLPSSLTRTLQRLSTDQTSRSRSRGIGASLDVSDEPQLGISTFLKAGGSTSHEQEILERVLLAADRVFSPSKVRQLLLEIVDALGLDFITIFIDEWMSLGECQVEFAERLRQCLFGESRISVKIAADPFQGQFHNSGQGHNFRGLDVGGDIFPAVNLDYPFRDRERHFGLYSEVLYRRLVKFEPRLIEYYGPPPLQNPGYFIDAIFASRRAFEELCNGAQGLCRDFLEIFEICARDARWDLSSELFRFELIRGAIMEQTESTYGRVVKSIDSNALLFNVIRPYIMKTSSRYFLVEAGPNPYTPVIADLATKRIIHNLPMSSLHPTLRGEYECFEIDYGIFIDIMRAMAYSTGIDYDDTAEPEDVSSITSANRATFMFDPDLLEKTLAGDSEVVLCPHCANEFSTAHKAYQTRKICPLCYQDQ
jgi:hypothetical protein